MESSHNASKGKQVMLSVKRLEDENRKGLYEVLAEIAEKEGNFSEAASLYQRAATFAAHNGEPKGLTDYVSRLIQKADSLRAEILLKELEEMTESQEYSPLQEDEMMDEYLDYDPFWYREI